MRLTLAGEGRVKKSRANVGIVASVLGHSTEKTAERYYNQARSFDAYRHYHDLVQRERRAARPRTSD